MKKANSVSSLEMLKDRVEASTPLLGYVVWHVLPDLRITEQQIGTLARDAGLKDAPRLGNKADAFRRATTPSQKRGESRETRFMMRPVCDTGDRLIRHLVVEKVDARNTRLGHTAVYEIAFNREDDSFESASLPGMASLEVSQAAEATRLVSEARSRYVDFVENLTGDELTRYVMRLLDGMSRVTVHPRGAVYFVPRSAREELAKLQTFVASLAAYAVNKDDPCIFQVVPIVDVPDQREMVSSGLIRGIKTEIGQVSGDIAELLARVSKPDDSSVGARVGAVADMRRKIAVYDSILERDHAELKAALDILDAQVEELVDRASGADRLVAEIEKDQSVSISWGDGRRTAKVQRGMRYVGLRFNDRGWTVLIPKVPLPAELKSRPECDASSRGATVKTAEVDVAMLYVRAALKLKAPAAA